MTRLLRAYLWCQVSRLGLWAMRRQVAAAVSKRDMTGALVLVQSYDELRMHHADHCEALQHARAGR